AIGLLVENPFQILACPGGVAALNPQPRALQSIDSGVRSQRQDRVEITQDVGGGTVAFGDSLEIMEDADDDLAFRRRLEMRVAESVAGGAEDGVLCVGQRDGFAAIE